MLNQKKHDREASIKTSVLWENFKAMDYHDIPLQILTKIIHFYPMKKQDTIEAFIRKQQIKKGKEVLFEKCKIPPKEIPHSSMVKKGTYSE